RSMSPSEPVIAHRSDQSPKRSSPRAARRTGERTTLTAKLRPAAAPLNAVFRSSEGAGFAGTPVIGQKHSPTVCPGPGGGGLDRDPVGARCRYGARRSREAPWSVWINHIPSARLPRTFPGRPPCGNRGASGVAGGRGGGRRSTLGGPASAASTEDRYARRRAGGGDEATGSGA